MSLGGQCVSLSFAPWTAPARADASLNCGDTLALPLGQGWSGPGRPVWTLADARSRFGGLVPGITSLSRYFLRSCFSSAPLISVMRLRLANCSLARPNHDVVTSTPVVAQRAARPAMGAARIVDVGVRMADLAWPGAVPDEGVEHLAHRFGVAAHDRGGNLDVAAGIKVLPGEREPGVSGKLPEESPLRPPVALAEWMQCVDLAKVIGQPPDERVMVQAAQAVFIVQRAENNGRGGIYVLRQAEHGALGYCHRPDLPGPLVNVTENPLMDLLQVGQVVAGDTGDSSSRIRAACVISRSAASSAAAERSPSSLYRTPVTGSLYGSSGTHGCR
jgi:hypothetical protein